MTQKKILFFKIAYNEEYRAQVPMHLFPARRILKVFYLQLHNLKSVLIRKLTAHRFELQALLHLYLINFLLQTHQVSFDISLNFFLHNRQIYSCLFGIFLFFYICLSLLCLSKHPQYNRQRILFLLQQYLRARKVFLHRQLQNLQLCFLSYEIMKFEF